MSTVALLFVSLIWENTKKVNTFETQQISVFARRQSMQSEKYQTKVLAKTKWEIKKMTHLV